MYMGWENFCLLCNQELPRHLAPDRAGCGVSDKHKPQIIVLFHLISALKREAPAGGSAIIQLNSAREITALWQQVHLQSLPSPHPPSSDPQA